MALPAPFVSPDAAPEARAPTIIDTGSMGTMLPHAKAVCWRLRETRKPLVIDGYLLVRETEGGQSPRPVASLCRSAFRCPAAVPGRGGGLGCPPSQESSGVV